ncbi:MAG: hypothetical protein GX814_06925 [Microbacteriaceae bacterium]|nr:hypothetical protein [Microbacteriaceae bacterium]
MREEFGNNERSWSEEVQRQTLLAFEAAHQHSLDDSYPDFETELLSRYVFTVDEQLAAALRFEEAGRAVPQAAHIQLVNA